MDRGTMELLAKTNAWGRTAIGAAIIASPGLLGRGWVGDDQMNDGAKVLARALGARDVALGLGLARALSDKRGASGWLAAAAIADLVDAGSTLAARKSLPAAAGHGVLALAAGSAVQCILLATALD